MPLPGGPSDKAGNSYERRWTVFSIVDLLDSRATAIRIEVPGDDGVGSEFGVPEWHQAKRQRAAGPWTINALVKEGVLPPWQPILGRGERCVFVSSTSADELRELAERAGRQSRGTSSTPSSSPPQPRVPTSSGCSARGPTLPRRACSPRCSA